MCATFARQRLLRCTDIARRSTSHTAPCLYSFAYRRVYGLSAYRKRKANSLGGVPAERKRRGGVPKLEGGAPRPRPGPRRGSPASNAAPPPKFACAKLVHITVTARFWPCPLGASIAVPPPAVACALISAPHPALIHKTGRLTHQSATPPPFHPSPLEQVGG